MNNISNYKKIDYIAHIARTISCHSVFSPLEIYELICKYNSVDLVIKGIGDSHFFNLSLSFACEKIYERENE